MINQSLGKPILTFFENFNLQRIWRESLIFGLEGTEKGRGGRKKGDNELRKRKKETLGVDRQINGYS